MTDISRKDLRDRWSCLAEVHAAPEMTVALVAALVAKHRMLKKTRKAVARVTLFNLLF